MDPRCAMKDRSTAHQHRVILNSQRSQVSKHNPRLHIRLNRLFRRADLQSTSRGTDQRVDP